ncbi:hypothetical protein BU15DRAFT_58666 [Melanogaster broomeanus]|nr:hypothetical protein BU15DRAFT_58666 [Melanogaster broomeanus]
MTSGGNSSYRSAGDDGILSNVTSAGPQEPVHGPCKPQSEPHEQVGHNVNAEDVAEEVEEVKGGSEKGRESKGRDSKEATTVIRLGKGAVGQTTGSVSLANPTSSQENPPGARVDTPQPHNHPKSPIAPRAHRSRGSEASEAAADPATPNTKCAEPPEPAGASCKLHKQMPHPPSHHTTTNFLSQEEAVSEERGPDDDKDLQSMSLEGERGRESSDNAGASPRPAEGDEEHQPAKPKPPNITDRRVNSASGQAAQLNGEWKVMQEPREAGEVGEGQCRKDKTRHVEGSQEDEGMHRDVLIEGEGKRMRDRKDADETRGGAMWSRLAVSIGQQDGKDEGEGKVAVQMAKTTAVAVATQLHQYQHQQRVRMPGNAATGRQQQQQQLQLQLVF